MASKRYLSNRWIQLVVWHARAALNKIAESTEKEILEEELYNGIDLGNVT